MKNHFLISFLIGFILLGFQNSRTSKSLFYTSDSGKLVEIKTFKNSENLAIGNGFIVVADSSEIIERLKSCSYWSNLPSTTYIIDSKDTNGLRMQAVVEFICNSQKLLDSDVYLLDHSGEFENVDASHCSLGDERVIHMSDSFCKEIIKWDRR